MSKLVYLDPDLPSLADASRRARVVPTSTACAVSPANEAALLAALDAPLEPAPTLDAAFAAKAARFLAVVDALAPTEGLALARRFAADRPDDPILARLARFNADRRARIHASVVDPKRRAARAGRR
jgi:hypothetical protein